MEVVTRDQPGVLARIAMALVECKAQVLNAKIATFGERAEDIFYITDENNRPIESAEQLNKLRETIIHLLDR
jgi:[protein-PII] uridylyltransferase